MPKSPKFPSELRFDLVSKDWVVIATGRAKKPASFKKEGREKSKISKKDCPFCRIETQEEPIFAYRNGQRINNFQLEGKIPPGWTTILIPNKYPAFLPHPDLDEKYENHLYQRMNAVGYHELVVTREHDKSLALLPVERIKEVFDTYQERWLELMKKDFVNYISIFHNHGQEAGASQPHPHSQIITTPLIDVDLKTTLARSENYFKEKKACIYCRMNSFERKERTRVVFENKDFLVLCPFASKAAFEMIISPQKHLSYFERITESEKKHLAQAFKEALSKLYRALGDPAYNFYLHTAPCDGQRYDHYHWHWTIIPKTSTWAGFEIGTRMEISAIEPEKAAQYLRKQ